MLRRSKRPPARCSSRVTSRTPCECTSGRAEPPTALHRRYACARSRRASTYQSRGDLAASIPAITMCDPAQVAPFSFFVQRRRRRRSRRALRAQRCSSSDDPDGSAEFFPTRHHGRVQSSQLRPYVGLSRRLAKSARAARLFCNPTGQFRARTRQLRAPQRMRYGTWLYGRPICSPDLHDHLPAFPLVKGT